MARSTIADLADHEGTRSRGTAKASVHVGQQCCECALVVVGWRRRQRNQIQRQQQAGGSDDRAGRLWLWRRNGLVLLPVLLLLLEGRGCLGFGGWYLLGVSISPWARESVLEINPSASVGED